MRRLRDTTLSLLRARLADRRAALPFAEAVTAQLAHPLGTEVEDPAEAEARAALRIGDLLFLCEDPARASEAVELLATDPVLLAAVFQNADLLFLHAHPFADVLSMRTLEALHRTDDRDA